MRNREGPSVIRSKNGYGLTRIGHAGDRCGAEGCPGDVVSIEYPPKPDFWVRVHANGSWWCSEIPPVTPNEHAGHLGYRCNVCACTFRIVEGGPLGN
jgi:hypothetical protein